MTDREKAPGNALRWAFGLPIAAVGFFALLLFILRPGTDGPFGSVGFQLSYVFIRVFVLIGLAYALAKYAKRSRFQTVSTTVFVGFIEQVFLKGIGLKYANKINPENMAGIDVSTMDIFFKLAQIYMGFIPIVMILAFLGMESTRFRRDWSLKS